MGRAGSAGSWAGRHCGLRRDKERASAPLARSGQFYAAGQGEHRTRYMGPGGFLGPLTPGAGPGEPQGLDLLPSGYDVMLATCGGWYASTWHLGLLVTTGLPAEAAATGLGHRGLEGQGPRKAW